MEYLPRAAMIQSFAEIHDNPVIFVSANDVGLPIFGHEKNDTTWEPGSAGRCKRLAELNTTLVYVRDLVHVHSFQIYEPANKSSNRINFKSDYVHRS